MWNNIIKPDSVQNGVGLLRLSIRFIELQSKPFLSMEMMMFKIAIFMKNNTLFNCHYISYNIPITEKSMTTNINKIDWYENLTKYFIITFNHIWNSHCFIIFDWYTHNQYTK